MNELPVKWKAFKILCILQMTFVIVLMLISMLAMFSGAGFFWPFFESCCYAIMIAFLYLGLNILNENYPDTLFADRQRRAFNLLFLGNFLLIAYLFARVLIQWRYAYALIGSYELSTRSFLLVIVPLIIAILVFIFNIIYLVGMYKLRVEIQDNNRKQINDDFIA